MKFLILKTDYPEFLRWLYAKHPGLEKQPYEEQMRARNDSLFGAADFYSSNLRKLGHEAWDIHANNEFMQKAWAGEHGICIEEPTSAEPIARTVLLRARRIAAKTPLRYVRRLFRPVLRSLDSRQSWFYDILLWQIKHYKPDIVLNQDMGGISSRFLKEMKLYVRLLMGQHAATQLSETQDWDVYDLVISSFPPTVEWFSKRGISTELNRLGFEPRVLTHTNGGERTIPISFIGSFYPVHQTRIEWLEYLSSRFQVNVWSPDVKHLPASSSIRRSYVGPTWGKEMYQLIRKSVVTLNHHGSIPPYANNCRLFEATGVGTLLITDWKENLHEIFEPGKEVVAYRTPEECAELIQYYLEHDDEREAIARAGQNRTLREHTYYHRMQELVESVCKYL